MADNTINYGFPYPTGGDRVAVHSDVERLAKSVDARALVTNSRIDDAEQEIEDARWAKPSTDATSESTLDSLPPGSYPIRSGTIASGIGLPVAVTGFLDIKRIDGALGVATFWARRGTGYLETYAAVRTPDGWGEWRRSDIGAVTIPETGLPGQVSVWGSSSPAGVVPELTDELAAYGVQVHNKARGGQWSSQTVANIGCTPINLPVSGGTIPASGSVEINAADSMLDGVDRYLAAPEPLMGWLGGVYGELVGYGTTFADRGVRFERAHPGAAVTPSGAPAWVPEVKTPAHLNILGMGKNDLNVRRTPAQLALVIARKDGAVAYWRGRGQEFLILGHFVNNGTPASDDGRTQIEADNADSAAKYPDNFINMQTLLSGQELWDWTGITPTSEDRAQQSLGNMPPSIQGSGNHLNEAGDRYLSWKIAQWAVDRGLIGQGMAPFSPGVTYLGDGVYEIN